MDVQPGLETETRNIISGLLQSLEIPKEIVYVGGAWATVGAISFNGPA